MRVRVESTGQIDSAGIYVYFYASADTSITSSDIYLGRTSVWLSAGKSATATLNCIFPVNVPQGLYYVGWIIDQNNAMKEADENNNTAYRSTPLLRVVDPFQSAIVYVDAQARGANNGASWKNAFTSLQDALAVAASGGEIQVAAGVYTPDQGVGTTRGDREAAFVLGNGITIRGGYGGAGAPDPDVRNIQAYPTILSGDLRANDRPVGDPCDLWKEASRTDNSRHVLTVIGKDRTTTLDGVHVIGGYAFGPSAANVVSGASQGAGLILSSGSLMLRDCTFSGHWASGDGGAIYSADSRLELADCTFRANGAGVGANDYSPVHQSRGTGGAIRSDGESQMTLSRCKFYNNFAGVQGGALNNNKGSVVLTRCLFLQNKAGGSGGAFWNSEGQLNLVSCVLNGNRSGASGGAIVNAWNGILSAANCSLQANYSEVQAGAIHNFAGGKATLWNCTLAANRQGNIPGAIGCWPSYDQAGSELTIVNCILWDGGGELSTDGTSIVTIAHTNIQGGWPGTGNFVANPLFVLPAGPDGIAGTEDDNLRLGPSSPCVDRGDSVLLPQDFADLDGDGDLKELLPLDLDGKGRITGTAVDMGAYETQPAPSSAPTSSCSGG